MLSYQKVMKQFLGHADCGREEEGAIAHMEEFGRLATIKRFGAIDGATSKKSTGSSKSEKDTSDLRRTKSFHVIMCINNILRLHCKRSLADFIVQKDAKGAWPDPWTWQSLSLAPDKGPDMVCVDHYLR